MRNTNVLIIGIMIFGIISLREAYGYIDPGSGSIVIQVIIGALVGVGVTLKMYWYKLKTKLSGLKKKEK